MSQILAVPRSAEEAEAKRVRLKVLGEMQPLLDDTE